MDDLISTLNRMIDNQEKFCNELAQKLEEQNKALIEIDQRIGKIIEVVK